MTAVRLQVGHYYRDKRIGADGDRCFEVIAIVKETIAISETTLQRVLWRHFADPVHLRMGALEERDVEEISRHEFLRAYDRIVADRDREWGDEKEEEEEKPR